MPSGSCWCGSLKYEYSGEPAMVGLCHCKSCQKISGGAYTTGIVMPKDQLSVTSGTPKTYTQKHESGMNVTIFFCGNCSSTLYKQADSDMLLPFSVLMAGTLDEPDKAELMKPQVELNCKDRMSWLAPVTGAQSRHEFE
ncbi:hypothetical protein PT974_06051 [Cladobotryum mycophilum]|uniref:CENP-V/GFA domain-containing protein n=1 Tax=Cladobotryum mycophilum TaxID=491253 RepID=A0ABR0SKF5_9HYPO